MASTLSLPLGAPGFPLGGASATGGGTGLVPAIFPVALAGLPFHLDHSNGPGLRFTSAPRIRQQADQGRRPGEASLNPEGDWRRSFESWERGAGQLCADGQESLPDRFNTSKGINPWTEGEISLHFDTTESRDSANTNLYMATAGSRLYVTDGATSDANAFFSTDPFDAGPTYTAVTGTTPAVASGGIASAGHHVFIAYGASGIWHTEADTATATEWATGQTVEDVWYVKGRVMTVAGAAVYNPTHSWTGGTAALPTALYTHPNDAWSWVGMAEGLADIYMAGFAGDTSVIYRTAVEEDGTPGALDVPVVAGRLPEGEIVRSIGSYLDDFILLGTDKGVRVANTDANGNLLIGPLIETGSPVRAFEGQERFVWFTWEDYDATEGGLGRLDLTATTQRGAPAYASDLMATTTADIVDVVTFDDKRIFSISGDGFYAQDTDLVASAAITTGHIRYGLTDEKLAKMVSLRHSDLSSALFGGTITVAMSTDDGTTFTDIGSAVNSLSKSSINAGETLSNTHDLRLTLTRDATTATLGPTVTGMTLFVHPHTDSTKFITAALVLGEAVGAETGIHVTPAGLALAVIEGFHENQAIATFQSLQRGYSVTVEDYDFATYRPTLGDEAWNGTLTVRMKRV